MASKETTMPTVIHERDVHVVRRRHAVDTGRGTLRSLNGIDGMVYRKWMTETR